MKKILLAFIAVLLSVSAAVAESWYDSAWQYRQKVTIDRSKVSGKLVDFPVLVKLDSNTVDQSFFSHCQADGDDILFTTIEGSKLSFDKDSFHISASTTTMLGASMGLFWVRVPKLYPTNFSETITSNNLTTTMTADNAPSPKVASASSEFSSDWAAWEAFNHAWASNQDAWFTADGTFPCWLKYDFAEGTIVNKATIRSRTNEDSLDRCIKDFKIQGSNNDTDWVDLSVITNQVSWSQNEARTFDFENNTAYRYYRLYITANNGGGLTNIGELEFRNVTINTDDSDCVSEIYMYYGNSTCSAQASTSTWSSDYKNVYHMAKEDIPVTLCQPYGEYLNNPVFDPLTQAWAAGSGIDTPCMRRDPNNPNLLWLWYGGRPSAGVGGADGANWKIGVATSTDNGLTWHMYSGNPIIARPYAVGDISVMWDDNKWKMWTESYSDPECVQECLVYYTSTDGINWTEAPESPLITGEIFGDMTDTEVLKNGTSYYLYVSSWSEDWHVYRFDSPDGVTWGNKTDCGSNVKTRVGSVVYNPTSGIWHLFGTSWYSDIRWFTSTDGVSWTEKFRPGVFTAWLNIAASAGGPNGQNTHWHEASITDVHCLEMESDTKFRLWYGGSNEGGHVHQKEGFLDVDLDYSIQNEVEISTTARMTPNPATFSSWNIRNGRLGQEVFFNGNWVQDWMKEPYKESRDLGSAFTISMWMNFVDKSGLRNTFMNRGGDNNMAATLNMSNGSPEFDRYLPGGGQVTSSLVVSTGTWNYVTVTYDSSQSLVTFTVNKSSQTMSYMEIYSGDTPTYSMIGAYMVSGPTYGNFFYGTLDEIRAGAQRSSEWSFTEYTNQSSPETFSSFGNVEQAARNSNKLLFGNWRYKFFKKR